MRELMIKALFLIFLALKVGLCLQYFKNKFCIVVTAAIITLLEFSDRQ
jgi:hypothetical protein